MNHEIKYTHFKVAQIQGRYVTHTHIMEYMKQLKTPFHLETLGASVKGNPIYGVTIGHGPKRILMWSQMHGNESTTTKAVLDLLNYLKLELGPTKNILQHFTLKIIPILNPDGAKAYTRVNANQTDLNRDAQDLSQPESKVLKWVYDNFEPHFCFNLHDQRTIFNVGETEKPATVSFLAPAFDEERNVSQSRLKSMQLIAAMNKKLQEHIPGQIGRYDDGFNANCVGDAFQMLQTPTILFEAGHFSNDYERETTRRYIFMALQEALSVLMDEQLQEFLLDDYLRIPENQKMYCDVLVVNAHILDPSLAAGAEVAILYQEKLEKEQIVFVPTVQEVVPRATAIFGHETKDASVTLDKQWMDDKGISSLF